MASMLLQVTLEPEILKLFWSDKGSTQNKIKNFQTQSKRKIAVICKEVLTF